jgi:hypothetical protein
MRTVIIWDVTPYDLGEILEYFDGILSLHLQDRSTNYTWKQQLVSLLAYSLTLKIEIIHFSETVLNFCPIARRQKPESPPREARIQQESYVLRWRQHLLLTLVGFRTQIVKNSANINDFAISDICCEVIRSLISSMNKFQDCFCGLVVRVPGYRSRGGPGINSASWVQLRSYLKEKVAASV